MKVSNGFACKLTKEDEPAIAALMAKYPCWSKKTARRQYALTKFRKKMDSLAKKESK